jgi:hypothetical protein
VKRESKKIKKAKRIMSKSERLERILKKLVMEIIQSKLGKERKAKLDAVKTIKQLYLNMKTKSQMFVDEKLIYI